jgi:hypothetical protein
MSHFTFAALPATNQNRTKFLICAAAAAGAIGIFVVPWFVPFQQPIASLSYTYGFNNLAAWLAVAALLAAFCFILLWRRETLGAGSLERRLSSILPDGSANDDRKNLLAAFVVVALLGAALQILWYSILPTNYFGEIRQHVSRLDQMILGRSPHLDFQYNFGPGMLYLAYFLYRLGAGALSIDAAYCTTLSAYWVIGTFLSYYVIKNLNGSVKRTSVFLCISLLFFHPVMMGLQYTPVRYFLPLASLVFIHRSLMSAVRWRYLTMAIAAFLLPLMALAFSPDTGIATTLAMIVYFLTLIRTPLGKFSYCALATALSVVVALATFSRSYLNAIEAYSSSVACFPIFPTLALITFLAATFAILPNLAIIGLRDRTSLGSLSLAFTVVLGLGIPQVLGRCDLVHVCFNGIGVLLLSLSLVTTLASKRVSYAFLCGYLLLFPFSNLAAFLWLGYARLSYDTLRTGIFDRLGADAVNISFGRSEELTPDITIPGSSGMDEQFTISKRVTLLRSRSLILTLFRGPQLQRSLDLEVGRRRSYGKPRFFPSDLSDLLKYEKVGTPFAVTEDMDRFLKINDRFIAEYWPGGASHFGTAADVARKLRDLDTMKTILVPKQVYLDDNFLSIPVNSDLSLQGRVDPVVQRRTAAHILTQVNMFPIWLPKAKNTPYYPEVQIMAAVAQHYVPVGEFRDFRIAAKRSDLNGKQSQPNP